MTETADARRCGRDGFTGRWAAVRFCLSTSAALAVLVGVAVTALAQNPDSQALNKRIDRLERLLYLGGTPAAGGAAARPGPGATLEGGPIAARMDVRITALEGALASQTGPIEEILHRLDRMESRLGKLVADIDFRLRGLEGAILGGAMAGARAPDPSPDAAAPLGAAPDPATVAATPPALRPGVLGTLTMGDMQAARLTQTGAVAATPVAAAATAPPLVSLPPGPPRTRYDFARSLLKRARYDEAESAFRQFIAAHGDDPLAGNAQYWLAETFYVRGRYEESAKTYLDGYQKFPEGVKAPDNLLKLGVSLARLGDSAEACTAFDKLAESFPDANQPIKQRAQRERARISCP